MSFSTIGYVFKDIFLIFNSYLVCIHNHKLYSAIQLDLEENEENSVRAEIAGYCAQMGWGRSPELQKECLQVKNIRVVHSRQW